jgi:ABC-type branched-subunit amino acid transport system substrate-binding protein
MNHRNRFPARRRFLKQSAALSAGASLAAPAVVLAQVQQDALKLGLLHAVRGPDAVLGRACREAALLALHEVNQGRRARALAPLLAVSADAAVHAQPAAAVTAMQAQGVRAVLALLPAGAQSMAPLQDTALSRLTPAALACDASAACRALLQPLPAAMQLAVASTYAAVRALDAVLQGEDDAAVVRLGDALHAAGLVQPLAGLMQPLAGLMQPLADGQQRGPQTALQTVLLTQVAPAARSQRA